MQGVTSAKILIVEEDASALNIMRDYLTRAGFKIYSVTSGWEVQQRLREVDIDLIISGTDLDHSNFHEKLIMNPETREIPLLAITPPEDRDAMVRTLRSGVDDCIMKPFDPVILVARVQAILERQQSQAKILRYDGLTRLLNRPTLFEELQTELDRAKRYQRKACALLIDTDDFKRVNEENGVNLGDLLLTCFSGIILSAIRSMDIAGRHHGQCIMVYLPETPREGGDIFANRVVEKMRAVADTIAGIQLTFSVGITEIPVTGLTLEALFEALENALRLAQVAGGGQLVFYAPSEESTKK